MESYYICPIQVSLSTLHKEIYQNCVNNNQTEISLRGLFKLEPHPHWSPLAVSFEFSDEQPGHFYMVVAPRPPGVPRCLVHTRGRAIPS